MIRSGIGYDVHRFAPERRLILGGVEIPHHQGLDGHSDADVLSHAIADALLGALALPDIGYYFPPTDPQWKDLDSLDILRKCRDLLSEHGYLISNLDSTLVAEAPKILPHAPAMKDTIARVLDLHPSQIGIKATTNEKMGFLGRQEGIAALATCTLLSTRAKALLTHETPT